MTRKFLPGIIKVGYCKSSDLQPDIDGPVKEPLKVYGTFKDLNLSQPGSLSYDSKIEKGNRIYNVNLIVQICDRSEELTLLVQKLQNNNYVFRATTVDGKHYLIGTDKIPYPVFSHLREIENMPSGKNSAEIQIFYSNTHPWILLK